MPVDVAAYVDRALILGDLFIVKSPSWTEEEDEFLRQNLGWMSEEDMAYYLGRTTTAVHLRWIRDLGLPAPSKTPGWITTTGIARRLGVNPKSVIMWIDRGLLPARILPGARKIRVVREITLLRWAVNPMNWIYFRPWQHEIPDAHIRRLIALQAKRWNDEWWTPGQTAEYHGVHSKNVNQYIHQGKIKAVKWGNWWIPRSEATRSGLYFPRVSGSIPPLRSAPSAGQAWSDEGDAFILLAKAVGVSMTGIDALSKLPDKKADYRWRRLHQRGEIQPLIDKFSLPVLYRPETGDLLANWQDCRREFPRLAKAMDRFAAGTARKKDAPFIRGVLYNRARWYSDDEALIRRLQVANRVSLERLYSMSAALSPSPLLPLNITERDGDTQ